ncbi:glycosyltransferase family A protein [Lutibacter sp.]|uniref:glycosyltransferase family 2 protein n=1 Tax=Lutibacter sp. TaxID=1925666 RepID=UPI001A2DC6B8|nr:glycosyltransferase family A protein [Lutibacter sp.]MBI9042252.1 glycosyltransferase family 2 protein [Lutibacter sp.]
MNNPKISIIIPCYNQAQYLEEALQSVLNQTYTHWECIIVNDGSPDNTEQIVLEWTQKDRRFKYLYKENGGLSSARNAGIEKAQGEFILPLDADDKIGADYITLGMAAFSENSELKVVYCKAEKFGTESGMWNLKPFSFENLAQENMIFCTALFKKEDWKRVNGYDLNMKFGFEDWEFWISVLKDGGTVKCLNKVCFYYRIKKASMLKDLNSKTVKYSYNYLALKHTSFFIDYLGSFNELNNKVKALTLELNYKRKNKLYKLVRRIVKRIK